MRRADNIATFMCGLSRNSASSKSLSRPKERHLYRPVEGHLYRPVQACRETIL